MPSTFSPATRGISIVTDRMRLWDPLPGNHPRVGMAFIVAALAASSHGFAAIGAESPRRFMLLHGSGQSAGGFVNSKSAAGAKNFLSGVPLRVDAGGIIPPNWQFSALDAGSGDGSWWTGGEAMTGSGAAIANVEAAIQEQQAVGIVGHEQGALLAAIVAARAALGEGPPLKFAVICGATMPKAAAYVELLQRLSDAGGCATPTLHCIGTSDPDRAGAEELASHFGASAEIMWHDNGSAMPDKGWWERSEGYFERVTGGNRWVTQYGGARFYDGKRRVFSGA